MQILGVSFTDIRMTPKSRERERVRAATKPCIVASCNEQACIRFKANVRQNADPVIQTYTRVKHGLNNDLLEYMLVHTKKMYLFSSVESVYKLVME